ncbi:alpha/beta fold hydrolase [Alkalimarinus coralli]|uniref:alpha/beta fold hydrolase n=1 Tax=Alkalimarinus coralli TaxID=2935863 RepID=UPI00202B41C6|nr:alpha/beta hydrolase [Alkalimarinus coralli]
MAAPLILSLAGCSLPLHQQVEGVGGTYQEVTTDSFKHVFALNHFANNDGPVVVYIEGDGTPWATRRQISNNPTPFNPLLFGWFLASNGPAAYLGRPCYFELDDDQCSAYWYTHGRYSDRVVESLVDVLHQTLKGRSLILVGHSGGGTLAMLMADRMNNVSMVVTIAGNLSVQQWAEHHQYSALSGSLDPMHDLTMHNSALGNAIPQIHFYSPNDEVIKPEWIEALAAKQANAELIELPVEGHSEGWNVYRDEVMKRIKKELDKL